MTPEERKDIDDKLDTFRRDMAKLLYPHGRQFEAERLDAIIASFDHNQNGIDRTAHNWWRS